MRLSQTLDNVILATNKHGLSSDYSLNLELLSTRFHLEQAVEKCRLEAEIHDPFKLTVLTDDQKTDRVNSKNLTFFDHQFKLISHFKSWTCSTFQFKLKVNHD